MESLQLNCSAKSFPGYFQITIIVPVTIRADKTLDAANIRADKAPLTCLEEFTGSCPLLNNLLLPNTNQTRQITDLIESCPFLYLCSRTESKYPSESVFVWMYKDTDKSDSTFQTMNSIDFPTSVVKSKGTFYPTHQIVYVPVNNPWNYTVLWRIIMATYFSCWRHHLVTTSPSRFHLQHVEHQRSLGGLPFWRELRVPMHRFQRFRGSDR